MFSRTLQSVTSKVTSKSTFAVRKVTCQRALHLACRNLRRDIVIGRQQILKHQSPVLTATFVRYIESSTTNVSVQTENAAATSISKESAAEVVDPLHVDNLISQIPEPPTPIIQEIVSDFAKEPTLQSLDLGGWAPWGILQQILNYLHTTTGLPWWASILVTTVCVRTILFPIVIKIQTASAKMNNIQPQIQYLQSQLTDARKMGDQLEVARISYDLHQYMKEKGVSPLKNTLLPMAQAPIFLSFFWGLKGMVQAPVESLKDGGLWWFVDLTASDPYYLLPLITSLTLFATIEIGTDTVRIQSLGNMRYVFRALPVIVFPFIMNFEGAILCYWVYSNTYSLFQVILLRIPKVREFFKIPPMLLHDPKTLPLQKKKFVQGFKDSWTNIKLARDLSSRDIYDESVFKKAGTGPAPKTYKFNPTKRHPITNAILSKKTG